MKKFTKLLGIVLLVALVLSLGITSAFAANPTLKVTDPVDGHKYSYFQLFTGDVSADGKTLSNVKWGSDVAASITYMGKATEDATELSELTITNPSGDVPPAVLDYLSTLTDEKEIADTVGAWVTGDGTEIPATGIEVLPGYYVVKDAYTNADGDGKETTTLSTNIVQIIGDVTIKPKAGTTEHKKEVVDINDTTDTVLDLTDLSNIDTGKWTTSADYDFGDVIPFKLTTKIASDFAKYTEYYLAVSDNMGEGLTLNADSIKVYVDGELARAGEQNAKDGTYYLTTTAHGFKVEFAKLNGNAKAAAGKDVVVYYTATLNADGANVVIGNPGNPNTSYAEFSNNPNDNQNGKGKTPDSTVVVFTFKTDVDKIDSNGTALPKAGFTLYKKVFNEAALNGKTNVAGTTPAGAKADTFPTGEFWYEVGTIAPSTAGTNFEFDGIDDGTYKLVESVTPDGYNTMDPITLVVTATHGADSTSSTKYSVSVLGAGNDNFKADAKGGEIKFTKKNNTEKTLDTGEIYSEIINNSGTQLPSTGGIGTTIFYVVGSILVVAAGVLLITKKRMGRE